MRETRAILCWSCAAALVLPALGGCSDDPGPADGGGDVGVPDGKPPASDGPQIEHDGPVQPKPDGEQPWADQGQLQCAPGIPANCCELMRQHEAALAEAKLCTAGSSSCNKLIAGDLPCGCKTFVDSSKTAAVDTMTQLEQQWKSAGCTPGEAGCSSCQDPKSSNCESLGGAQKCIDIL